MYRIMFDSITPDAIPESATLVAGYINGEFKWSPAGWARFPNAGKLTINVTGNPADGGQALDVENGDATPADAPVWFDGHEVKSGLVIYCNRSTLPAVEEAMGNRSYYRWVATLDGTLAIPGFHALTGPAAVQFASASMAGANVDVSFVMNDGFVRQPSLAAVKAAVLATQNEAATAEALIKKYEALT